MPVKMSSRRFREWADRPSLLLGTFALIVASGIVLDSGVAFADSNTIDITSTKPVGAIVGVAGYTPTATDAAGDTVTITIDAASSGVCAINGSGVVAFTGVGTCTVDYASDAPSGYTADSKSESFSVAAAPVPNTIAITSTKLTGAIVGVAGYTPTATDAAGDTVTITIDAASSGVCAINGSGVVAFTGVGTCTVDYASDAPSGYTADSKSESFSVAAAPVPNTIAITSTKPTGAIVGVAGYTPTATDAAGGTVTITIHAASSG